MSGRLIVVEGLDGSGKSTLASGLARSLGATLLATPGRALQPLRASFHRAVEEDPDAMVLFYAASCVSVGRQARQITAGGRDVVVDRYLASTLAYGAARGSRIGLRNVLDVAPTPDFTVLLAIDEDERRRRLLARGANRYDVETLNPTFAEAVMAGYRRLITDHVVEADERATVSEIVARLVR